LVEGLFNRLAHSGAPASLLAAHAHLELVQIHPFPDGNGRTARLVAAYILMRSGFRSTLFTSVEQHCVSDPLAYLQVLRAYSRRRITFEECAVALLRFNVASAWFAAWFKARRARWHRHCDALGVPFEERQGLSEGFEDGKGSNELCSRVSPEILPLRTVIPQLSPAGRAALAHQVGRLASEEGEASRDMVSQRPLSATLPELAPAAARGAFSQTRLKRMTPFGG
jgi:hypothetical protein